MVDPPSIFEKQQQHIQATALKSIAERKRKLKQLEKALLEKKTEAQEALYKDFSKSDIEVNLTELFPVLKEIRWVRSHLSSWLEDEHVATPIYLTGTRSKIAKEPKGHVLILSPWNYPINLSLIPLVSAYAAGNAVLLKPSEFTPHASQFLAELIAEVFEEQEISVIQGEADTAAALTALPFNHIFFTGSPAVGKKVMAAAAKNLASVTLELGGKSPFVVHKDANLELAAERMIYGKCQNAGQICVAPDYALVHESVKEKWIAALEKSLEKLYGKDLQTNLTYPRIVSPKHFERLNAALKEAKDKGAQVRIGGQTEANSKFIAPTFLENVPKDAQLMQEEIFGPILPIIPYSGLKEAVQHINASPKPLAMYLFTKSKTVEREVLKDTRAGALCINEAHMHFAHPELPFGGSNNSGIGKSHGYQGFLEMVNQRAVLKRQGPFYLPALATPPYSRFKRRVIELMMKWF